MADQEFPSDDPTREQEPPDDIYTRVEKTLGRSLTAVEKQAIANPFDNPFDIPPNIEDDSEHSPRFAEAWDHAHEWETQRICRKCQALQTPEPEGDFDVC